MDFVVEYHSISLEMGSLNQLPGCPLFKLRFRILSCTKIGIEDNCFQDAFACMMSFRRKSLQKSAKTVKDQYFCLVTHFYVKFSGCG